MTKTRTRTLVTGTEWAVSTTSGSGIDGVQLDVYKIVYKEPTPENRMTCDVVYMVKKMPFASHGDADDYALAHGYLIVYEPKK